MKDNKKVTVMYTSRSKNGQTGDVPGAWVGKDVAEMRGTCADSGCPYYEGTKIGDSICRCYAWQGHARQAFYSVSRANKRNPQNYTLLAALKKAVRSAQILRLSVVGDPSAIDEVEAASIATTCESFGISPLGYIAGWEQAPWWKGILRASVSTKEEMERALRQGWKVARVAPMDAKTPPEPVGIICPIKLGARSSCNSCKLCLYTKKTPDVIWFPDHTPLVKARRAQAAKRAAKKALETKE
jgi:hypothetical protein